MPQLHGQKKPKERKRYLIYKNNMKNKILKTVKEQDREWEDMRENLSEVINEGGLNGLENFYKRHRKELLRRVVEVVGDYRSERMKQLSGKSHKKRRAELQRTTDNLKQTLNQVIEEYEKD